MQNKIGITPKNFMMSLIVIHLGLTLGVVLFGIVAFTTVETTYFAISDKEDVFLYLCPIIAIIGYFVGDLIFKKLVNKQVNNENLKTKLVNYQSALIVKFALIEGPILLSLVVLLMSGNLYFLLIAVLLLLYFISLRPTKEKIINAMKLNYEQKIQFDNSEEIL